MVEDTGTNVPMEVAPGGDEQLSPHPWTQEILVLVIPTALAQAHFALSSLEPVRCQIPRFCQIPKPSREFPGLSCCHF